MSARSVVVYSNPADPVAKVVEQMPPDLARPWLLGINELAAYIAPGDWLNPLEARFPEQLLRGFDGAYVVNRVFSLEGSLWPGRLKEWRKHEQWLHAGLQTLFARGRALAHDTGVRGTSRSLLPLPIQWQQMQGQVDGVGVPRFVYGMAEQQPDLAGLASPMQKSIWSWFSWTEEKAITSFEKHWNRFYVEKPTGTPLICYYFGSDRLELVFPRVTVAIDRALLLRLAASARSVFRSEVGEMLIYRNDDGGLTFQAFSPYLHSCSGHPLFAEHVRAWLYMSEPVREAEDTGAGLSPAHSGASAAHDRPPAGLSA